MRCVVNVLSVALFTQFLFDSAVSLQGKELWASAQVGVTRDNK